MNSSISTSSSSKSTSTDDPWENKDSCYFPGCRKDANCNCEICLESINATLDLLPMSIQKSTLSKLSASKTFPRTPIPFKRSVSSSTPTKSDVSNSLSPALKSTAKSNILEEKREKKKERRSRCNRLFGFCRFILGLGMVFAIDSALSWLVSEVFQPTLSPEIVTSIGEKSMVADDLNGRFDFIQKHLGGVLDDEEVLNCSSIDSNWKLNQVGPLVNSRCSLYKSISEEVSIWGWPLQNAGLLVSGFSCRSLTVLSGKITEWPNGRAAFVVRNANTSWVHGRLSSSVVQMDPNTWFLEHTHYPELGNSRLSVVVGEYLKFWIVRAGADLKSWFSVIPEFFGGENNSICPT